MRWDILLEFAGALTRGERRNPSLEGIRGKVPAPTSPSLGRASGRMLAPMKMKFGYFLHSLQLLTTLPLALAHSALDTF